MEASEVFEYEKLEDGKPCSDSHTRETNIFPAVFAVSIIPGLFNILEHIVLQHTNESDSIEALC